MNLAADLARRIVERLRAGGHSAYWVGGCVRDLLLGIEPEDYDVATSARPEEIEGLFPGAHLVGAAFGVAIVREEGAAVEVATYRSEREYRDGRRPGEVRYETEPRLDASRRDFTMNAIFLDPVGDEMLDYFHGIEDLEAGVVRAIGDARERFEEDHLRLLRAVRFAARFGFEIEEKTWQAMRGMAPRIERISAERIREELNRILSEGGGSRGLRLLDGCGLLAILLPELKAMQGVEQPPEFHPEGDVWTHTLLMLDGLEKPIEPVLAWGVLLHDVGKPVTQTRTDRIRFNGHVEAGLRIAGPLLSRLKFSAEDREQVLALVENHMRFMDAPRMKQSTLKRFLRLPRFEQHLELHRVDCQSSHGGLDNYGFVKRTLEEMGEEAIAPAPLVRGEDVLALGVKPGPRIRDLLRAVEDAQLEGRVSTREEALELLAELARSAPDGA